MKIAALILGFALVGCSSADGTAGADNDLVGALPIDAAAAGTVLGIKDGVYEGDSTLISQTFLVPNIDFHTTRTLRNGIIDAKTTTVVMNAGAHLRVKVTGAGTFDLLDVDANEAPAGDGTCDATSCTFQATVMSGHLHLKEKWVATANGFSIPEGSQTIASTADATYTGELQKTAD